MPYYMLTEAEIALLQKVIDRQLHTPISTGQGLPPFSDNPPAPETYIAWPPEGGIPAMTLVGDAGPDGGADQPGSATCDVYKIDNSADPPEMAVVSSLDKVVYNLSTNAVPQKWIIITRTKGGRWICLGESGMVKEDVITDFQVDTDNQKLQVKTRSLYVMPEAAESGWTDKHTGSVCP